MAQLTAEQLAQIEAACEQCSTGFGQQRADAERFVVGLRSAENALDMAQFIIANSQSDNARFHAAIMLKEATLRDWHKIPSAQRNGIKVNLLQHVVQSGALLKHFVRQPLLQVVAIMVKRGWFEEAPASFSEFLAYVQHLLENPATRTVGALMMRSLLEEFSSSNRSAVGLSWEFHNQCHHRFHAEGHLKMLFRLALTLLGGGVETLRAQSLQQEIDRLLSDAGECHWVGACVDIVNQTLSWDFSDTSSTGSVAGLSSLAPSSGRTDVITPGKAWSDVLVQQSTLDLLYGLYAACRFSSNANLAHACRQTLVNVSAIKGDVFPDESARLGYLDHSLQSVLQLAASVRESEYVDVALIVLRLITNFQASAVMRSQRAQAQLEALGAFTCALMQVESEVEDSWAREALDHVLECWSTLAVQLQTNETTEAIMQRGGGGGGGMLLALAPYTGKILRAYIEKCLRDAVKMVEEWDAAAEEHEDKSVLEERLTCLGCIARPLLADAISLLVQLIHERTEAFRGALLQGGGTVAANQATVALEQLYWLISIAGRCVADDGEGEIPMVPDAVARASMDAGLRGTADPVVELSNQIVETIKVLDMCSEAGQSELVSPAIMETLALFLTRLAQTYLFPQVSEKYELSPQLTALFAASDSGSAASVLSFIVERTMMWLTKWTSEEEVMSATTLLLLSLASRKNVAKMLLSNSAWLCFSGAISQQISHDGGVRLLPSSTLSAAMQALCLSVSCDEERAATSELLRDLIRPVVERTGVLLQQGTAAAQMLERAVNLLHGACRSADFFTYDTILELVAPVLAALPAALEACRDHNQLTAAVVQLYVVVGEAQVSFLSAPQMGFFNRCCLQLLQTFARSSSAEVQLAQRPAAAAARSALAHEFSLDSLREHVLALLQLLLHLARKDAADFSSEGQGTVDVGGGQLMDVGDVVLYGLALIQPLITPETLGYPSLARDYFAFLSYLIETYAQKVSVMDGPMLDPIIACLIHAVSLPESDIARKSVEAMDALATHALTHPSPQPAGASILERYPLLQTLLHMLLFKQFNAGVLDASCDALLLFISCERRKFEQLMTQVVEGQAVESQRHQLSVATSALLTQVPPPGTAAPTGPQKRAFRRHVRAFLQSVRPFLVTI